MEGTDGPAGMGQGAEEREATIPLVLTEDVLGFPEDSQLQWGWSFILQSGATSPCSSGPAGPAFPQQPEEKSGAEWQKQKKRGE